MKKLPIIEDHKKKLKNGYGTGVGQHYKPWIRQSEAPNQGVVSIVSGLTVERDYLLLSNHENNFFHIADFNDAVIDIREQFPLFPLEFSMRLAEELGIDYPVVGKNKIPIILTTDFVLTYQNSETLYYKAFSVKPENKLVTKRDFEKQEIERAWWESIGIPWQIYTDDDQACIIANNIKWTSQPIKNEIYFSPQILDEAKNYVEIEKSEVASLINRIAQKLSVSEIEADNIFKTLIYKKYIDVDLNINIQKYGIVDVVNINHLVNSEGYYDEVSA